MVFDFIRDLFARKKKVPPVVTPNPNPTPAPAVTVPTLAIINSSTVLTDAEIAAAVPAFQTQVSRDFAPVWGRDAKLVFVPKGQKPPDGSWWMVILDNSDQAGALGYHDMTPQGQPLGKVFAATDKQYNESWTVTVSHEITEQLADPGINLTAFIETQALSRLFALEVADACENDQYGYKIGDVLVSDFVYPAWFGQEMIGDGRFDFGGHITKPFTLLPGGYISYFDIHGGSWQQFTAELEGDTRMRRPAVGSRRERRRTPRDLWKPSVVDVT